MNLLVEDIKSSIRDDSSLVYFYRKNSHGWLVGMTFLVDGKTVAVVDHETYAKCHLTPGTHYISVSTFGGSMPGKIADAIFNSHVEIEINLSPGKVTFLKGVWDEDTISIETVNVERAVNELSTVTYNKSDSCT